MKNKDKILEIIQEYCCGITATQVFETLKWQVDKTTVYRNIEKLLIESEIIEDFNINWEKIYSIKTDHHHNFTCNECWMSKNIWCFFDEELNRIAKEQNITIQNHSFSLKGLCESCNK